MPARECADFEADQVWAAQFLREHLPYGVHPLRIAALTTVTPKLGRFIFDEVQ
jgi:hypothetical protein